MSDLRELYQEMILDHSKKPRNFHVIQNANRNGEGYNPLCGDRIKLYVRLEGDMIREIGFEGSGCAISKASASMMTENVKGKTIAQAEEFFSHFHKMLSGAGPSSFDRTKLGKLGVFSGVSEFPVRVKCATLAWHTLRAALRGNEQKVSTEE